jgi:hypothetical protein
MGTMWRHLAHHYMGLRMWHFDWSDSLKELQPALDRLRNTSCVMGDMSSLTAMSCATWKLDNKQRYDGVLENLATNYPMMIVINTFDGHTPPQSAYNTSAIFEDGVVLEINGYGHSSANLVSKCATQHLATYTVWMELYRNQILYVRLIYYPTTKCHPNKEVLPSYGFSWHGWEFVATVTLIIEIIRGYIP